MENINTSGRTARKTRSTAMKSKSNTNVMVEDDPQGPQEEELTTTKVNNKNSRGPGSKSKSILNDEGIVGSLSASCLVEAVHDNIEATEEAGTSVGNTTKNQAPKKGLRIKM